MQHLTCCLSGCRTCVVQIIIVAHIVQHAILGQQQVLTKDRSVQLALHPQLADSELPVVEGRWHARLDEIDEVGVGRLEIVDDGPDLIAFGVERKGHQGAVC